MKKTIAIILSLVMLLSLFAGCGKQEAAAPEDTAPASTPANEPAGEEAPAQEVTTIIWKGLGNQSANHDDVLAQINAILIEDGLQLQLDMISDAEYADKMNMAMTAGEAWDICFTSSWLNSWLTLAQNGAFLPLDDLLPEYAPDLYAAIPENLWEAMRYADGKLYTISRDVYKKGNNRSAIFHKQMIDDAGIELPEEYISSYDELVDIYKQMKAAYPDSIIWSMPDTYNGLFEASGFMEHVVAGGTLLEFDPATETVSLENFYNRYITEWETMDELKALGIYPTDITFAAEDSMYTDGYIMATRDSWKGAGVIEGWGTDWYELRFGQNPLLDNTAAVASMLAINARSENPEKALQLINCFCTNPELARLLAFGIEGVDYNIDENNMALKVAGGWMDSVFSWAFGPIYDPLFVDGIYCEGEFVPGSTEIMKEVFVNEGHDAVLSGFVFDVTGLEAEAASASAVYNEYAKLMEQSADHAAMFAEYKEKWLAAGGDKILEAAQTQVADFLANK